MEGRAVLEYLHAVGKATDAARFCRTPRAAGGTGRGPPASASVPPRRRRAPRDPRGLARPVVNDRRRRWGRGLPGRRVQNHRGLPFDLAEEPAKLPVADHAQRACRRAGTCQEEIQLQPRHFRLETDDASRMQMAQVVARYPVPAEDQT